MAPAMQSGEADDDDEDDLGTGHELTETLTSIAERRSAHKPQRR